MKTFVIRRVHRTDIMVDAMAGTHKRHAAGHQYGNAMLEWRQALRWGHEVGMVAGIRNGAQGEHGGGN